MVPLPIHNLKTLLDNLPHSLPIREANESHYAELIWWELSDAVFQRVGGDEALAVGQNLQSIFVQDWEVVITECGPAVCAVVDILSEYLRKYPDHPELMLWIKKISHAAKEAYKEANVPVSLNNPSNCPR